MTKLLAPRRLPDLLTELVLDTLLALRELPSKLTHVVVLFQADVLFPSLLPHQLLLLLPELLVCFTVLEKLE